MPLSYATYTGNGSTTTFSVPFPYLLKSHVKVFIGFNILTGTYTSELVDGVGFTWSSGTQVQCTTAPTAAQTLTVIRRTPSSSRIVDWNDGSNLIAADMDTADLQNLYVVQEQQDRNDAGISASLSATTAANTATTAATTATSTANTALSTANTALTNANTAVSTANTASTNASAAVSTANTASTNASAAVATANTASTNASAAVTTANAASSTANTASTNASAAVTTANTAAADAATALSTANTALTNANTAVTTANTASSNASAAVTTANTASTNASNAVTTANTASTNASSAVTTANAADNKADQAIAAVSNSINYQLKANVAAIPASPANDTYIEVQDSTGLESFTPLAGTPAGFVGDSGLSVRLRYTSTGSTWNWLNYYANNADARYLKQIGGTLTGQLKADDSTSAATPGYAFDGDPNTGVGRPGADELALITGGTARLTIDSAGNVAVAGALTKGGNNVVTVGDSGTVTSAMLADGTILNADVNASAAIAGTKISPNFGSQTIQTTGVVSHALGTAAAPTLTFTGDTNTGVYSPGTDQVAISTNGTGRLFVDANGNVGVGTSTLSALLHIGGTTAPTLKIEDTDNGFAPLEISATNGGRDFTLTTNQDYYFNNATTTYMTIQSSGNVGVGTTSPLAAIHVVSTTDGASSETAIISNEGTSANTEARLYLRTRTGSVNTDAYIANIGTAANTSNIVFANERGSNAYQEAMRIDGSGRVGIGTSSPGGNLTVTDASTYTLNVNANAGGAGALLSTVGGSASLALGTNSTERLRITAAGNVGIGTTTVSAKLHIAGATGGGVAGIWDTTAGGARVEYKDNGTRRGYLNWDTNSVLLAADSGNSIKFSTNAGVTQHATIDSSGRLLVGTSSSIGAGGLVQSHSTGGNNFDAGMFAASTGGAEINLQKSRNATIGSHTVVSNGDELGSVHFWGSDGSAFKRGAKIAVEVDGTPGANDMPGRIVLATTADGASSPTERMRIQSDGYVLIGKTNTSLGTTGVYLGPGDSGFENSGGTVALFNRLTNDGTIISLRQANTEEGTISVSGTTVSYNGAHLSRWSQLPSGAERTEILRGSVLSNIDEMCEWGEEDNEQLNRMKVSDIEGDKNVSGVFQAWDDDDDTYTNDFYCAMTGDFVIRIGAGVTVERGDLLMSAGDGTAKPQDDDIIRSKTIAKVTSTNVSCTYDDGSYCVPCVLMAC